MGLCGILLLAVIFLPLPLWVFFLGNANFYHDFLATGFGPNLPDEYDFIIVGAGSAGAIVANRLSKHHKILLVEAGGDPLWVQRVPAFCSLLVNEESIGWGYHTVPQQFSSFGIKGKAPTVPRGKSLGGSSNLNAMLYVRGHPKDYDNWAELTGDNSWSYKEILPYFSKSIIYNGSHAHNKKHYGGSPYGGVHVSKASFVGKLETHLVEGLKELGVRRSDVNGPQNNMVMDQFEFNYKDGYRWDTYNGFIKPILDRENLFITRYSQAIKIKFDKQNRAVGVWYVKNGVKKFARARKEIIVSAGSIDSPKLLMLSGIGLEDELRANDIKPRVNLPVGRNLMDHVWAPIYNIVIDEQLTYSAPRDFHLGELKDYVSKGGGMLSSPALMTHQAFVSSSLGAGWPDIQFYFSSISYYWGIEKDFAAIGMVDLELMNSIYEPVVDKNTFVIIPSVVRPKSRGTVKLRDSDPFSPPLIDPRYLEHPDDMRVLLEGYKFAFKLIYNTTAFQKLGAYLPKAQIKGCKDHDFGSDLYWDCYIRHTGGTIYHPVGTCKMGRNNDPTAVVDTELRVLGTKGLRVIDASIMPVIVNGNTHAPAMMIGEKGADMIREQWSKEYLVCHKARDYYANVILRQSLVCEYSRFV